MTKINLLPPEKIKKKVTTRSSLVWASAVIPLLVIFLLIFLFLQANSQIKDKEEALTQAKQDLSDWKAKNKSLGQYKQRRDEISQLNEIIVKAVSGRVYWARILNDIALNCPDDVWLASLNGSSTGEAGTVEFECYSTQCPNRSAYNQGTSDIVTSSYDKLLQDYEQGVRQLQNTLNLIDPGNALVYPLDIDERGNRNHLDLDSRVNNPFPADNPNWQIEEQYPYPDDYTFFDYDKWFGQKKSPPEKDWDGYYPYYAEYYPDYRPVAGWLEQMAQVPEFKKVWLSGADPEFITSGTATVPYLLYTVGPDGVTQVPVAEIRETAVVGAWVIKFNSTADLNMETAKIGGQAPASSEKTEAAPNTGGTTEEEKAE